MKDGISIVICCYNSAGRIPQTLANLLKQEDSESIPWEVIVVDNASEDNTADVARETWGSSQVPFFIVPEFKKGLSNARQAGIRESHYNLVCFIDDDNWVCSDWIKRAYSIMNKHPEVALLGGMGEAVFEKEEPAWFKQFEHAYAIGPQAESEGILQGVTELLYGAGMTLRKDVWIRMLEKGFKFHLSDRMGNNITSGGDTEMGYAIKLAGYEHYYEPLLIFKHYMPAGRISPSYLVKLAGSFGRSVVIARMYKIILKKSTGLERLKTENYLLSLLQSLYSFISYLPVYYKLSRDENTKIDADFHYAYKLEYMREVFNLFGRYGSIFMSIKKAAWHNVA